MLSFAEYGRLDGIGLGELIARREVSAEEVRQTALAAIERLNPQLNAVIRVLEAESAREVAAGLPAAPFSGVPFAIKELALHAANVPFDLGSRLTRGTVFPHDSELMARFRRAGLLSVATTQTPELGYCPTTETVLHGPVHNPWRRGRSPGGSSGGSGAAVAAGILPLAHANDGGCSIRIPASCNGLVGLKPTRDRVPTGPDVSDPLFGLAVELAVTRSVRDTAALLDLVHGPDPGAPGELPPPRRPFAAELQADPGRLRVAFTTVPASGKPVESACRTAVERTAALLAELGHQVEEGAPAFEWEPFLRHTHVLWTAFTAASADLFGALAGRTPSPDLLERTTWECYLDGRRRSAAEVVASLGYNNVLSRSFGAFFARHDVWLTPTLARPPVEHGEIDQNREGMSAEQWTEHVFDWCPFTPMINATGQPAISLPLHTSSDGLPIGVQLVGRFAEEATLLCLAGQLERAAPWAERRPPVHVSRM